MRDTVCHYDRRDVIQPIVPRGVGRGFKIGHVALATDSERLGSHVELPQYCFGFVTWSTGTFCGTSCSRKTSADCHEGRKHGE